MITVLIVDPNKETRLALEAQLSESNQFDKALLSQHILIYGSKPL